MFANACFQCLEFQIKLNTIKDQVLFSLMCYMYVVILLLLLFGNPDCAFLYPYV